jgi:hypothetical protein
VRTDRRSWSSRGPLIEQLNTDHCAASENHQSLVDIVFCPNTKELPEWDGRQFRRAHSALRDRRGGALRRGVLSRSRPPPCCTGGVKHQPSGRRSRGHLARGISAGCAGVATRYCAGSFSTRLLWLSATYRVRLVSTATPVGSVRPVNGSTVCAVEPAASFSTRLLPWSAT